MRLRLLDVRAADLAGLAPLDTVSEGPLVLRVSDADAVTLLAAVTEDWGGSWGVWLVANEDYSAGLIARDVKTLSTLRPIDHVVIDGGASSADHAEVVVALLSERSVTLHNAVANITHAYNRPAPARPITVWSVTGDSLEHESLTLRRESVRGALTTYSG